jgi:hypothetical protein
MCLCGIILSMAVIRIPEVEAERDFLGLLVRVRSGEHFVIESALGDVELIREDMAQSSAGGVFRPRPLSESIALAKKHAEEGK